MAGPKPQVLMLATDWPSAKESCSETLMTNKALARDLADKGAKVFCTVPHFRKDLQGDNPKQIEKCNDAKAHGVTLIGADYRRGRKEEPHITWITDYWRQYYHDGVRHRGYNGQFTHIIGYVPDTYHSALDLVEDYKEENCTETKLILLITDKDTHSVNDEEIKKADAVYVLGPKLFCEYHKMQSSSTKLMPLTYYTGSTASDSVARANPLTDRGYDINLVTLWPFFMGTTKHEQSSQFKELDDVVKAIDAVAKCMNERHGQKVHWDIRGVPDDQRLQVERVTQNSPFRNFITVTSDRDFFTADEYTVYLSPLRSNPCDLYCLQAIQQGKPALLHVQSGIGQYLKQRSGELGNQLVESVLVNCDTENDRENWTLAFDRILKNGDQTLQNAKKMADKLQSCKDENWCGLVNRVVPDAIIDNPGKAHVPFGERGSAVGNQASSYGHMPMPHPINPVVLQDQEKAMLENLEKKKLSECKAPMSESTPLECTRPWADVFSDANLALLAMKLTKEMPLLAKLLGKKQHDVDRYISDNPHNSAAAVSAMLSDYKTSSPLHGKQDQTRQLVDALIQVNRIDLALEVAGPQMNRSQIQHSHYTFKDSSVKPQEQRLQNLTQKLVEQWRDEVMLWQLRNDTEHVYKMSGRPRGFCIIVNIKHMDGFRPREGSERDVRMLENVFSQLHFKICKYQDPKAHELQAEIKRIANNNEELRSHDCLVLILMSHGEKGMIYCSDGKPVELKELYGIVDSISALKNKPKVYIIQACRADDRSHEVGETQSDGSERGDFELLPRSHDTLLAYSTVDGTKSFRNTAAGSWYIQALVENLCDHACHEHMEDILTRVNSEIKRRAEQPEYDTDLEAYVTRNQCSESQTRLTKKLYLFPGC